MSNVVSWKAIKSYEEIKFEFYEGIAKITINRPQKRNAFTPLTVSEMIDAMAICREDPNIDVIILTGEGPDAFCSGGDQSVRGVGAFSTNMACKASGLLAARPPMAAIR